MESLCSLRRKNLRLELQKAFKKAFLLQASSGLVRYGEDAYKPSLKLQAQAVEPTPILLSPRGPEGPEQKYEASWYDDEVID